MDIVMWNEDLGMSADEIVAAYPGLSLSDVHAALAYYFDNIAEIRDEIRRHDELAEELRESLPFKVKREAAQWLLRDVLTPEEMVNHVEYL